MYNDKDIEKNLNKLYRKFAIVNSIMAIILAAPTLYFIDCNQEIAYPIILAYMLSIIFGILLSPKIINKFWND